MAEPEWERIRDEISNDCTFDYVARRREVGPGPAAIEATEAELVDACKRIATLESQLAEAAQLRECHEAVLHLMSEDEAFVRYTDEHGFSFNIICSDTFAWACADGEEMLLEQAPEIWRVYKEQGWPGVSRWVQEKRGGSEASPFIKPVGEQISVWDEQRTRIQELESQLAEARELEAMHRRIAAQALQSKVTAVADARAEGAAAEREALSDFISVCWSKQGVLPVARVSDLRDFIQRRAQEGPNVL